jgi:hypothetical protein
MPALANILRNSLAAVSAWLLAATGFLFTSLTWCIVAPFLSIAVFVVASRLLGQRSPRRVKWFALSLPLALFTRVWFRTNIVQPDQQISWALMEGGLFFIICAVVIYGFLPFVVGKVAEAALVRLTPNKSLERTRDR